MRKGAVRSWGLVAGLAGLALVAPGACGPAEGGAEVDPLVTDVLATAASVVREAVDAAGEAADVLATATAAWADAPDDALLRAAAQEAWVDAFLAWQAVEVLQLGPAGSSLTVVGGEDVRDAVYSWPTVNRCRVDQVTAEGGFDEAGFLGAALVPELGLDALETLLFSDAGNGCLPSVSPNQDGTWATLGEAGVRARRAAYAAVLAAEVVRRVDALREAWGPDGTWAAALAGAGADAASPFDEQEEALDAVLRALFYVETQVKDRKLGRPLGLVGCTDAPCPEEAEARLAEVSVEAVAANLEAFDRLFFGLPEGEGRAGLDDLLEDAGHGDVAEAVRTALDTAKAAAASVDTPLDEAAGDVDAVALFDAVKSVTDLLKGDVATVLALDLPSEAAGDAD